MRKLTFLVLIGMAIIATTACSEYNKVMKSTDLEYKYTKAIAYYEDEEYYKAYPLIEELVAIYRGQKRSEKLYFMYAYSDFYLEDYLLASHRFNEFTKTFPTSRYTEECAFMSAFSLYKMSPPAKLDQSQTYSAISGLQLFIDRYPRSSKVDSCNTLIIDLENKLEEKTYMGANQYKKMEDFTSAVITYENLLRDFPDTKYREQIYFNIFDSYYTLAYKSVVEKKAERIDDALKAYINFVNRYPSSDLKSEADSKKERLERMKEKLETVK